MVAPETSAAVKLERMASGHLNLVLRERGDWAGFDAFANEFLSKVDGELICRVDSPVDRVWTVRIGGEEFWLAFDDWQACYELSSRSVLGDAIIESLASTRA